MGIMKRIQLEEAEQEIRKLDEEWERANPDLVKQGIDRETWEAFEEACGKDD